jgi:hypothetical protein
MDLSTDNADDGDTERLAQGMYDEAASEALNSFIALSI